MKANRDVTGSEAELKKVMDRLQDLTDFHASSLRAWAAARVALLRKHSEIVHYDLISSSEAS